MTVLPDDNRLEAAECGLLSSMLLTPDIVHDVLTIVGANDFRDRRNRTIFEQFVRLFNREHGTIEIHTLAKGLLDAGDFDRIGGIAYLQRIVESAACSANAFIYARLVRENRVR